MTATRHHTHPSAACGCDTCELEHNTNDTVGVGFDFAVNPSTGTMVWLRPHNHGWRLQFAHHHPGGDVVTIWRDYPNLGHACRSFQVNADHQPPAATL